MKRAFTFLSGMLIASLLCAAEPDYKSYFTHPDARIVINFGSAHAEGVPYKNHTIPQKAGEPVGFSSGFGTSVGRADEPLVTWRFIQKTDYGDLYLFTIEQKGVLVKAVPILFSNSTVFVYNKDDILVQIDPYQDSKKN